MASKRRIFIAINLPEHVKKRLLDFQKKWEYITVRWTKKDSMHLTLVFVGYADEQEIYEICRLTKEISKKYGSFDINFEKIIYGPPGKPPRMIWLQGRQNNELSKIKNELENAFVSSGNLRSFRIERRPFSPHITLARTKLADWYKVSDLPPKRQEAIEQDFKAIVPVNSIDVMESDLKRDGAEYIILESCALGEN